MAVEIARMLAAFPSQRADETSLELRMEAYFEALEGVPVWAVSDARSAALRGEGNCDPRFAPTPTQLALLAKARLQDIRNEISELTRLEFARAPYDEPSPDERNRVEEGFAELRRTLSPSKRDTNPQADFEALCARAGVDPATVPDRPLGKTWGRAA